MTKSLHELCIELTSAKAAEEIAKERRIAVEEEIIALCGAKEEGSQTHKAMEFSIEITGVINRKMDWDKWEEVKGNIPEALRPIKLKPELDTTGVKYLRDNEPGIYALLPITATPGKTGVKLTRK
jgi:hypothetical protein